MTDAPPIAIAAPMTADEVRLELLAQVLILGVACTVAHQRVSEMTLAEGVDLPTVRQVRRMVASARRTGEAAKVRRQWEKVQARRRKDAEGVKRAEAIRLVLNERLSRKEVGERLGVHPWTVTRWLSEPEAMQALHTEARISTMLGALSLDDHIAWFCRLADEAEAKQEPGLALAARKAAADIEVKRLNGAAKVIVENTVQVANVNAGAAPRPMLEQVQGILAQVAGVEAPALDVEEVEGGE